MTLYRYSGIYEFYIHATTVKEKRDHECEKNSKNGEVGGFWGRNVMIILWFIK